MAGKRSEFRCELDILNEMRLPHLLILLTGNVEYPFAQCVGGKIALVAVDMVKQFIEMRES